MSVDGVWKVEMLGPYGWERISTAFLESGTYRTASKDHFSQGTYTQKGDHLSIEADLNVYGEIRSLFGRQDSRFALSIEADVSGDTIVGKANDHNGKFTLHIRATRLADLA
jgi:hypothetical protein